MTVVNLKSIVHNMLLCCVVTLASGGDHYSVQLTVENRVMNESMLSVPWHSVMVYYWIFQLSDI